MQSEPQTLLLCYPSTVFACSLATSSPSLFPLYSNPPMTFAVATGSGAASGGAGILYGNSTAGTPYTPLSNLTLPSSPSSSRRRTLHLVSAKKFSSRSRRNLPTTTTTDQEPQTTDQTTKKVRYKVDDLPPFTGKLPGSEPDFFQGPQWNTVGFIAEYIWILGGVFAVLGGVFAALNYNLGASDFKETPAYKESVQSQEEVLEQPEVSDSDVFDSNPTEVAPSLD